VRHGPSAVAANVRPVDDHQQAQPSGATTSRPRPSAARIGTTIANLGRTSADHERTTGTTSASAATETRKPAAATTGWAYSGPVQQVPLAVAVPPVDVPPQPIRPSRPPVPGPREQAQRKVGAALTPHGPSDTTRRDATRLSSPPIICFVGKQLMPWR
jgi:hypothetical protein